DIFSLSVTQTTLVAGTASANATLILQGGDVGLNSSSEVPDAIALFNTVNVPPILATNAGITVNAGATGTILQADLEVTDADNTPAQLTFTVTAIPTSGTLKLSGVAIASNDTFT